MIQNKGHHEHEYYTRCECHKCICDSYPYEEICYFCERGDHRGHRCENHLEYKNDYISCFICKKTWKLIERHV